MWALWWQMLASHRPHLLAEAGWLAVEVERALPRDHPPKPEAHRDSPCHLGRSSSGPRQQEANFLLAWEGGAAAAAPPCSGLLGPLLPPPAMTRLESLEPRLRWLSDQGLCRVLPGSCTGGGPERWRVPSRGGEGGRSVCPSARLFASYFSSASASLGDNPRAFKAARRVLKSSK